MPSSREEGSEDCAVVPLLFFFNLLSCFRRGDATRAGGVATVLVGCSGDGTVLFCVEGDDGKAGTMPLVEAPVRSMQERPSTFEQSRVIITLDEWLRTGLAYRSYCRG